MLPPPHPGLWGIRGSAQRPESESIHFLGVSTAQRASGRLSSVSLQLDLTRKKQIAAVAVLTRYFPLHRTLPTSGCSPLNGLGVHSTSKVPNWLRMRNSAADRW